MCAQVGIMEVGSQDVARTGLKGKGLRLLHVYGDQLWSLGGTKASPDPSFTLQRIFPQACN
jgi:translation initiation factor 2D